MQKLTIYLTNGGTLEYEIAGNGMTELPDGIIVHGDKCDYVEQNYDEGVIRTCTKRQPVQAYIALGSIMLYELEAIA